MTITESVREVIAALNGSISWHAEQGRPYSEQVDRDALAFILRLIGSHDKLTTTLTDCAEALAFARDRMGMCGEGDGKDRKADADDPTGSLVALIAARAALKENE